MRAAALAFVFATAAAPALAAEATPSKFGELADGRAVAAVTLSNAKGVSAKVIALGAGLQSVILPDRQGAKADVAPGYDELGGYLSKPEYFGFTVGRFANRIAAGRFSLDGKAYQTPVNNGANSLHGGDRGFDKVLWEVVETRQGPTASVTLRYVSPDGDMGYPGKVVATATYSLDDDNNLTIDYRASTDRPTIVNLTNHAYWNLAGVASGRGAMDHVLTIPADRYTPTDAGSIPTGELRSVAGGPFDFRTPHKVGERVRDGDEQIAFGRGYDHNWVVADKVTADQHLMARVEEPVSGRAFELWSNQPGLQFYSGNFMDGTVKGKAGRFYRMGDAIVLEPQLFPDAPNQPGFPSARLDPGQSYRNVMTYRFYVTDNKKP